MLTSKQVHTVYFSLYLVLGLMMVFALLQPKYFMSCIAALWVISGYITLGVRFPAVLREAERLHLNGHSYFGVLPCCIRYLAFGTVSLLLLALLIFIGILPEMDTG